MCHLVLFWWRRTCQSSHPRDSSAGGSRPAPATLRGPPTLTDEADTPKRLSSDEECLQHPKVTLVLSERCPPMPFSWCDIPSLPSLVFSTSPALLEKLLSFYYYPLFLPLSPAVPLSTLQPLDGRVEGLASEGSKGGQMWPGCGPRCPEGTSRSSHLSHHQGFNCLTWVFEPRASLQSRGRVSPQKGRKGQDRCCPVTWGRWRRRPLWSMLNATWRGQPLLSVLKKISRQ